MFNNKDIEILESRGISVNEASKQIERLRKGTRYVKLKAPATVNSGIIVPDDEVLTEWIRLYDDEVKKIDLIKFVPASGAASRMFKRIQEFLLEKSLPKLSDLLADNEFYSVGNTLKNIDRFAFAEQLAACMQISGSKISECLNDKNYNIVLLKILTDSGLNLANLPKGLISFHKYEKKIRTAFEEHIIEGIYYSKSCNNEVKLHFTVSPEHRNGFEQLLKEIKAEYEDLYDIKLIVEFSEQKPSTDTLSLDSEGQAFRNDDNTLLFRPGGHGALIENMNTLTNDIVFIKNIDNVVPQNRLAETVKYKKALGGLLLSIRNTIHEYLLLADSNDLDNEIIDSMIAFVHSELHLEDLTYINDFNEKKERLKEILNRPIRICGMVKNTGEPGGGPFWVEDQSGKFSLQIVEKAQIQLNDPVQKQIFEKSTHFNPVDIVCSITDYRGKSFDLRRFRDDETYFVAEKTKSGKSLKALELPGLWNGAMAKWITLFVEVPLVSFNPVKEINDLLRKEHQV